jgi:Nucleotidyl transferase AbiEii toxin, Type IV TA system
LRSVSPTAPIDLDPLAAEILARLSRNRESQFVILGGQFALKCYFNYRPTHDIDGWWWQGISTEQRDLARSAIQEAAAEVAADHGLSIRRRSWGDTEAFDLQRPDSDGARTVFSVQIAERTVELDSPVVSPWPPIRIETLRDNLGSKMNALVARGAPRDFRDVYEVVQADLATVSELWDLWQAKNPGTNGKLARAQVVKHLESIAMRRPLNRLPEHERQWAETLRRWVRTDLVRDIDVAGPDGGAGL